MHGGDIKISENGGMRVEWWVVFLGDSCNNN